MDQRQAALEGWLRFNDEDISFNRDGRLSPRQRSKLLWSAAWRLVIGTAVAVVAALACAVTVNTAIAELFGLVVLVIGLQLSWTGFAYLIDATSNAVAFVTAQLQTRVVHGRGTTFFANVGPIHKTLTRKAFLGITPAVGVTYHLYYAPGCRSLLALEAASATEPLPAHPFGPDSAHAWDRLRWSWILLTAGAFAALVGAHQVAAAHPAHPVKVAGVVQNYIEETTTGRSGSHTTRSIYLAGDDNVYRLDARGDYSPPAPDYYQLIGKLVDLWVDDGTTDVIALNDGDTTYAGDWYLHPEHEHTFLLTNAWLTIGIAAVLIGLGLWLMLRDRRWAEAMPDRPATYVPPTVHPVKALWSGVLVVAGIAAFIGLGIASIK